MGVIELYADESEEEEVVNFAIVFVVVVVYGVECWGNILFGNPGVYASSHKSITFFI